MLRDVDVLFGVQRHAQAFEHFLQLVVQGVKLDQDVVLSLFQFAKQLAWFVVVDLRCR